MSPRSRQSSYRGARSIDARPLTRTNWIDPSGARNGVRTIVHRSGPPRKCVDRTHRDERRSYRQRLLRYSSSGTAAVGGAATATTMVRRDAKTGENVIPPRVGPAILVGVRASAGTSRSPDRSAQTRSPCADNDGWSASVRVAKRRMPRPVTETTRSPPFRSRTYAVPTPGLDETCRRTPRPPSGGTTTSIPAGLVCEIAAPSAPAKPAPTARVCISDRAEPPPHRAKADAGCAAPPGRAATPSAPTATATTNVMTFFMSPPSSVVGHVLEVHGIGPRVPVDPPEEPVAREGASPYVREVAAVVVAVGTLAVPERLTERIASGVCVDGRPEGVHRPRCRPADRAAVVRTDQVVDRPIVVVVRDVVPDVVAHVSRDVRVVVDVPRDVPRGL